MQVSSARLRGATSQETVLYIIKVICKFCKDEFNLFMVYLLMLPVSELIQHQTVGWSVNKYTVSINKKNILN